MNPLRRLSALLATLLAAALLLASALSALAANGDWAEFGRPTARSSFGEGIAFSQPVTVAQEITSAELLVTVASSEATTVIEVTPPLGRGAQTLTYEFDLLVDGHLLPNTPLVARWRIEASDPDDPALGPEVRVTYEDDRFDWQTETGDLVRLHWYEGSDAFGERALRIAEDGVREASEVLGVAETDPVDFFVYADQDAFYDALGPGTRENVGGQANSEIRTMFALISPGEIDDSWVGVVIPHELAHLVFDTAASNPYHFPPRWLNEGLAVYLSEGYGSSDRGAVERSASAGTLIPIDGLVGQFPTSFERFSLAYSESVSAVDYLVRTHGQDALVSLIRSYAAGRTDDEAFEAALGTDMTGFGEAWLADLGAAPPTRHGPQPAPPGPVPAAWQGAPGATATPSDGTIPTASPGSWPGAPGAPGAGGDGAWFVIAVLAALVAVGLGVVFAVRARRRTDAGSGS